jgi:predicted nucleic acid-binding Zn ribbon protein
LFLSFVNAKVLSSINLSMAFSPLGDTLLSKLSGNSTLKRQIESSNVVEMAKTVIDEVLGADIGVHVRPLFLKNRTLTVSCASSTVAQEIRLRQLEIVAKINEKCGKPEVDRVRYLA